MTNFEKIKAMTVEEMADFIAASCICTLNKVFKGAGFHFEKNIIAHKSIVLAQKAWVDYLESEVQEDE